MPRQADPAVARVVATHDAAIARLRARTVTVVEAAWRSLPAYRDVDRDRFVRTVAPIVEAAQRQVSAVTAAYLAAVQTAVLATPTRPVAIPAAAVVAPRGVPTSEVYARPFVETWTALTGGDVFDQAVEKGRQRAVSLAGTDVQLARTNAARYVLERSDGVVGYRRVLHGTESCGLCVVASTQRYQRGDLMPIHPGCDCGVLPIYGDADPGQIIDPARLEGVHQRLEERFGVSDAGARDPIDYRNVLVVHEHGELGPVLGVRGQTFTGPADI